MSWNQKTLMPTSDLLMRCDTRMKLSDDLLLYGDKISMAVALEARVPMLDIELIEFVESLPMDYRVRLGKNQNRSQGHGRKILRQAASFTDPKKFLCAL